MGSSFTKVRMTYPRAKCRQYVAQTTCTLMGTDQGKAVYHVAERRGAKA